MSNNFLSIIADKDFINQSTESSFALGQDRYSDLSAVAEVKSNGDLLISTGGSIKDFAGSVSSTGDAYLTAQGDISFGTIALNNTRFYGQNGYAVTETTTDNKTSSLATQGNLIVSAQGAASFFGTDVSVGGDAFISADSLAIATVEDEYSKTSVKSRSTSSLVGGSAKKTVKTEGATTNNGSDWTISGDLQANIDGDLFVYGSSVSAQGDIALNAKSINVLSAADSQYDQTTTTKSNYAINKSITTSAKAAADIGYTISNKESSIVSNGSLFLTTSQGDINILGSNLSAQNALLLDSAKDVSIVAGYDGSMRDSQRIKSSLFTDWSFSKTTTNIEKETDKTAVASNLNAQDIRIYSADNLLVKGSNISAGTGEIAVLGAIDVKVAENIHFRSVERHESKVGLDTVILAASAGAIGSFLAGGEPLSGASQGFMDSTGLTIGNLVSGKSIQETGYREYSGHIATAASVSATQSEIALGSSSTIIAKNDVNLEAAKIETGTIGAGYQKETDGSLTKVNGEASLNITSFDETTTTQTGSYYVGFDQGAMMLYQMGKAAAVSNASGYIGSDAMKSYRFVPFEIPSPISALSGKYVEQFLAKQLVDGVVDEFNPSLITKPDITDPNIFNMNKPTISTDKTINTTFMGNVNVLD